METVHDIGLAFRIHRLLERAALVTALGVLSAFTAPAQTLKPSSCANVTLGTNGPLMGFTPSPGDAWHQDISQAAVDPKSDTIVNEVASDLAGSYLHPDFGSIAGGGAGIPYVVVDSTKTSSVPVTINLYAEDSDITIAPIPVDAPVEGSPSQCTAPASDQHMIVFDRATCVAYEYWRAQPCNSQWSAANTALWDFTKTEQRPFGATSVDAAGLSVFEGLVRYDEIVASNINHAIRFTAKFTKQNQNNGYFVAPATHASGTLWGTDNIIGMRLRLKANFDISGYSATNQIILTAMKKYGLILADNGSNLFFQGTPDARWNDDDLSNLKAIKASSFEVIQMGTIQDASDTPVGSAPVINSFTASATEVVSGSPVLLSSDTTGSSYDYIDNAGFTRGSITASPTQTTTYTLTSRNLYGSTTASLTIKVVSVPVTATLMFQTISDQIYGVGPILLAATSNSPAPISYKIVQGPATLVGSMLTVTGLGTITVQASQAASDAYTAASVTRSFNVTAPLKLGSLLVGGFASHTSSGAVSYVEVSVLDSTGAAYTSFTGIVRFTSSDPKASLPAPYTFQASDAGTHTFPLALNSKGLQSVTVTSGTVSGTQSGIAVVGPVVILTNTGLVAQMSVTGSALLGGVGLSSAVSQHGGLAIDSVGNVWSVTSGANAVSFVTSTGSTPTAYSGGGLDRPSGIAIDGKGSLWVANSGSNTVSTFDHNGTALSGPAGYGSIVIGAGPSAIAVDNSGGVWVTSNIGNSVTHILGVAAPVTPSASVTPSAPAMPSASSFAGVGRSGATP